MKSRPKVLMTTVYRDGPLYDYYGSNTAHRIFRLSGKRTISMGLRFIKQNIPGVEILEYPTIGAYRRALERGWDVVGLSFYLNETPLALAMARMAREAGAGEVWAGNYGALTPEVQPHFHRVFTGYAEHEIAERLGVHIDELVHPPLTLPLGLPFLKMIRFGFLFTTRGCGLSCTFCQTPKFARKPSRIPIHNIERVVKYYRDHGVVDLVIADENFGIIPSHARQVTELLDRHNILWTAMTRIDCLLKRFDEWKEHGLTGVMIGVESIDQHNLNSLHKNSAVEKVYEAVRKCQENGIVVIGFYMIGLESDTAESIRASVGALREMKFDLAQVCVLTPLPQTPLWEDLEARYGIDTSDYSKFDGKHLVWNHPRLGRDQVQDLLRWSFKTLYPRHNFIRTLRKHAKRHADRVGRLAAVPYLLKACVQLNLGSPYRQLPLLESGRGYAFGRKELKDPVPATSTTTS